MGFSRLQLFSKNLCEQYVNFKWSLQTFPRFFTTVNPSPYAQFIPVIFLQEISQTQSKSMESTNLSLLFMSHFSFYLHQISHSTPLYSLRTGEGSITISSNYYEPIKFHHHHYWYKCMNDQYFILQPESLLTCIYLVVSKGSHRIDYKKYHWGFHEEDLE